MRGRLPCSLSVLLCFVGWFVAWFVLRFLVPDFDFETLRFGFFFFFLFFGGGAGC